MAFNLACPLTVNIDPGQALTEPATPPATLAYHYVDETNHFSQKLSSGASHRYLRMNNTTGVVVVNSDGSGDYTTLNSALADTRLTSGGVINLYAGIYVESNPLSVPDDVRIDGMVTAAAIIIVASDPNAHIFQLGNRSSIEGVTVTGAYGANGVGVYFNGVGRTWALTQNCVISNCSIGCLNTGAGIPGRLLLDKVIITETPAFLGTSMTAVVSTAGAVTWLTSVITSGLGVFMDTAILCDGGNLFVTNLYTSFSTVALINTANGTIRADGLNFTTCATNLQISDTGTDTLVTGSVLDTSTVSDLHIDAASLSTLHISGTRMRLSHIINTNNLVFVFNGISGNDTVIAGHLSVGNIIKQTDSYFGEGALIDVNVTQLTNTDGDTGTWASIITDFFAGTAVNNCSYVGYNYVFHGINTTLTTGIEKGQGNIKWDYWNGTTWAVLKVSASNISRQTYGTNTLLNSEQMRFGKTPSWTTTSLNGGEARYWVRARVSDSAITTVPVVTNVFLHNNSTAMEGDGFTVYYGNARPIRKLDWHLGQTQTFGTYSGSNQDLYVSKYLGIGGYDNEFNPTDETGIGFTTKLPKDVDTCYDIRLTFTWIAQASAGDVVYRIRWCFTMDGDEISLNRASAPTTFTNEKVINIVETAPVVVRTQTTTQVYLDISEVVTNYPTHISDVLWISLMRDGTDGADTNTHNVSLTSISAEYVAWCNGDTVAYGY